jgi:lysophospholipase L1-like esterase
MRACDRVPSRWPAIFASLTGLVCAAFVSPAEAAPGTCSVPPGLFQEEPLLPKTTKALKQGGRVLIVAIGGASTQGNAAGTVEFTWPGRLATVLSKRYPNAQVTVVNLGATRLTAAQLVKRLERDVLDLHPTLVVLETGTTDAVRGTDTDDFRYALQLALEQIRGDGADVVLMDMQFSRRTHAMINFERYLPIMREVAAVYDVPVFPRHELMRIWSEANGDLDLTERDTEKRKALAIWLYGCIGDALAQFVTRGPVLAGSAP